jgi:hypothetical protein
VWREECQGGYQCDGEAGGDEAEAIQSCRLLAGATG